MANSKLVLPVLVISALVALVSTSPLELVPRREGATGYPLGWETEGDPSDKLGCASDRSSDYYGLGVRLGVYLSWLTAWVANVSVPDEIGGALDQNAIFLFALLIALGRCAITDLLSQMDGIMLMHLCGGSLFSVLTIWGYRTCLYRNEGPKAIRYFGGFGSHMRLLLCLAVSIIGLWFWYIGIMGTLPVATQLDPSSDPACDDLHTFFFAKLNARGGIRIYYIFICIGCTIYFGAMTIVSVLGPITRIMRMKWLVESGFFRTTSRLKFATGLNYFQLKWTFYILSFGNLFWIIFSMVMCEMTLNYNRIDSVLGENGRIFFPSQLLPFVIGLGSFCRVVYLRFELWRSPEDIKPSLAEMPVTPIHPTTIPHGGSWFKVFSPPTTSRHATMKRKRLLLEDNELDTDMVGQPAWWRYLVTWLPWLNAVAHLFKTKHNNDVEASNTHQNGNEDTTKQTDRQKGHKLT